MSYSMLGPTRGECPKLHIPPVQAVGNCFVGQESPGIPCPGPDMLESFPNLRFSQCGTAFYIDRILQLNI